MLECSFLFEISLLWSTLLHRVWDTLDAVQNGTPQQFGLPYLTWDELTAREVKRIVRLVRFCHLARKHAEPLKSPHPCGTPDLWTAARNRSACLAG